MPPKAREHREHNVYLITSVQFDNKNDQKGRLQVYQAFSSLDEANEFCEAKADELAALLGVEAPDPTLENYMKDGTFRMELPLPERNRDVVVETVIMPLMGGIIVHEKPVSRRTPAPKKTTNQKQKAKAEESSDHEEPDAELGLMYDGAVSPKDTKAIKTDRPSAVSDQPDSMHTEHRDSVIDSDTLTEADIAAACSGSPNCLQYYSYTVIGHHQHWSEDQMKVIIRRFGGTVKEKLPVYANDHLHFVILGSKADAKTLRRIKQKEFKTVAPEHLINQIRSSRGPAGAPSVTCEEVAKLCKQVPGKSTKKRYIKCEDDTDSDGE